MSQKRWTMSASISPMTLGEALIEIDERGATSVGRAFVNGTRVMSDQRLLRAGDLVEVWAARANESESGALSVLAFHQGFLVADKPAALPTTPDHRGARSLVSEVDAWLDASSVERQGPAHPVSRLDVGVSGAVLFALDHETRKLVEHATEEHHFSKRYVGIVRGILKGEGALEGAIGQKLRGGRSRPALRADGKPSQSRYRALGHGRNATLLELEPLTGRTHQLRLHLADAGTPLFGDRAHGGPIRFTLASGMVRELDRIMLHAENVRISRANGEEMLAAASPVPAAMTELWSLLDGDALAWNALGAPGSGSSVLVSKP